MVLGCLIRGSLLLFSQLTGSPLSTKGIGHLLLTRGHHRAFVPLSSQSHALPCREGGKKGKKREKSSHPALRDKERFWGWFTAYLPLLSRTTSPISLSYLLETHLLGWTAKGRSITTMDRWESLRNSKSFRSPSSKTWTRLALGGIISCVKFPAKTKPKYTLFFLEKSRSYIIFKSKMVSQR